MHSYVLTELTQHRAEVLDDSQAGKMAVITDHGRPVFLAVLFENSMVQQDLPPLELPPTPWP